MRSTKRAFLFGCATSALVAAGPAAAQETRAEVIHWWTSGGESGALQEVVKRFEAEGGEWVDNAVAGGSNARTQGVNRIIGGQPPTAMQFNTSTQFDELVANDLLNDIDEVAAEQNLEGLIPGAFHKAISRDGHVYAMPINIHGQNWLFYNAEALEEAGVEPPETWDDVVAAAPKLREAGIIPLAQGGEPWQERVLFNTVLLGTAGRELYDRLYVEKDPSATETEAFREVAETYGQLRELTDSGMAGRTWNLTTALVINGDAAMQVMGDWVKGEFIAAGLAAGEDYGCEILGEGGELIIGGDVFVFPATDDADQQAAQKKLAEAMFSPEAQLAFNQKKGSMPVRSDVDVSGMDLCAQKGAEKIRAGDQAPVVDMLISPDMGGAIDDIVTQYWNDPSMSAEEFSQSFADAMRTAS